jgi:hypothetical protein
MVAASGPGAASLLQISSITNTDDGDLFWQGNNFGQGNGGYNGTSQFTPMEWHRVIAAYDMAATPPVVTKFVDGIKQDDWTANHSLDNVRRALLPTAILFADGDQDERREMWVNSIQIRPGKLTDAQMQALGGPSAAGIPLEIPPVPFPPLTISRNGPNEVIVSWPLDAQGFVLDQSTDAISWAPAPGVVNNSLTVNWRTVPKGLFRLR